MGRIATCRSLVISFDFGVVSHVKAVLPAARAGYLSRTVDAATVQRVLAARLDQFCPPASLTTRTLVDGWRALGLNVRAWGVGDVAVMQRAIDAGVDGMTVDFPHLLLRALGRPTLADSDLPRRT